MDHIVVDVEIRTPIEAVPHGWDDTHLLGLACAVVYEFTGDRFRVFGPEDLDSLRDRLWRADRITGYNLWRFDLPVIWQRCREEWPDTMAAGHLESRVNDLLRRIWLGQGLDPDQFSDRHKGFGLDVVARATLKRAKIGHGDAAPQWYAEGDWARLVTYCLDDVALTRDLEIFAQRHGHLVGGKAQAPVVLDLSPQSFVYGV